MKKILVLVLFCNSIVAETIFLRDGSITNGQLKSQGAFELVMITEKGETIIPKSKIFRVIYKNLTEEEANQTLLKEIEKLNKNDKEKLLSELKDPSIKQQLQKKEELAQKPNNENSNDPKVNKSSTTETITKWSYVKRSAILPGWGHIFAKQYKTGIFYSAIFVGGFIFTGLAGSKFLKSEQALEDNQNLSLFFSLSGDPSNALIFSLVNSSNYESLERNALINRGVYYTAGAGLLGFYIFQLTHAYLTGTKLTEKITGLQFNFQREYSFANETGNQYLIGYRFVF